MKLGSFGVKKVGFGCISLQKPGLLGEAPLGALPRGIVGMPALNAAPLLGDTATGTAPSRTFPTQPVVL